MKKNLYILLLILTFSCKEKSHVDQEKLTTIKYYPSEEVYLKSNLQLIDLDKSGLNFEQLSEKSGVFPYEDKRILIQISDNQIIRRIIPFQFGSGLYKGKNVLSLTPDSILIDDDYPISNLKSVLKEHYTNNGKDVCKSDSPFKAVVEISLDSSKNLKDLKNTLITLTRIFDEVEKEVKDSIHLKIFFDDYDQYPLFRKAD